MRWCRWFDVRQVVIYQDGDGGHPSPRMTVVAIIMLVMIDHYHVVRGSGLPTYHRLALSRGPCLE